MQSVVAPVVGPERLSAEVIAQKRQANIEAKKALRERAKQLRREGEAERDPLKAKKASLEEAFILTKLVNEEDKAQKDRRRELVAKLVRDASVPRQKRFELAAGSANAEIAVDRTLSNSKRMARFAEAAWRLTQDFPENAEGYESLIRIARDSEKTLSVKILNDVLASSAPEVAKLRASKLLNTMSAEKEISESEAKQ